jgi:molecular chaperone DnaK
MTRSKLEELCHDLVQKTLEPVKAALKDAGIDKGAIQEIVMVGGMTRMPLVLKTVEDFFDKKPNVSVNPDEVVALGAAVQAGVFQGEVKDVLLLDVTPLSVGIETLGGVMTKLLERNTTIPASKSQVFSTAADNQTTVEIHVLQGEREMAGGNKTLGRFILSGIPMAPRGVPQVEVKFDIDANGILHVTGTDKGSGKSQSITIQGSTGLSKEEVERMKQEAQEHEAEDKKAKEKVEHQNLAQTMIYTAEKMLKDAGDKVTADEKKEVEEKIAALKAVQDGDDHEAIKKAADELSSAAQKVGAKMYSASAEATADKQGVTHESSNDQPIDAEFEEKKGE